MLQDGRFKRSLSRWNVIDAEVSLHKVSSQYDSCKDTSRYMYYTSLYMYYFIKNIIYFFGDSSRFESIFSWECDLFKWSVWAL